MVLILLYLLVLGISFFLLAIFSDEFFVESLDIISSKLKLPSDVAGATFMAVGSSAPEFFTAMMALFRGGGSHADVGAGTIVGSAIFNVLVIIGVSALFREAKINWQPVVRDTLFYSMSIVILLVTFWDGQIEIGEALIFVLLYGAYIFAVLNWRKWFKYKDRENPIKLLEKEGEKSAWAWYAKNILSVVIPDPVKNPEKYVVTFGVSVGVIGVLSLVLVEAAVGLGEALAINPTVIALTVLAAGTSIPDLLSSMVVAKRGKGDMAISNAVGSNIFDILIGLGLPWVLVILWRGEPVQVGTDNLLSSVFLLFATLLAVFFLLALRKWKIGPKAGWVLIATYVAYLSWNILAVV